MGTKLRLIGSLGKAVLAGCLQLNMEKEDIRNMQARGTAYAQNNFIGSQKDD